MRCATCFSISLLTFISIFAYCKSGTPAGIYVDNGFDQTSLERFLTKQEKREMELEILNLLGLPNRPSKGLSKFKESAQSKFLMDVYKSLMEKENGREEREADLYLSGEEKNAIEESDMIMTFDSISNHVSGVRHERGKRLWFNVADVPVGETIVGAELRIFQNENYTVKHPNAIYTVTAYELISSGNGEKELEYVTAVNTTASYSGWLELNLTSCFATWVAIPDANKGLYLSVHSVDKPGHELKPEDLGIVTVKGEDESKPFMVAFLKANNHVNVRLPRDTRRRRKSDYTSMLKDMVHDTTNENNKSCKIHNLYISFKDLKWHDWIIAPDGYQAYYCDGECNFPLNNNMNATNHAIVQTLVHLISPVKYPKPCCAPTKLYPISVLYHLNDANVMLKKYKRMVVKSCGCL